MRSSRSDSPDSGAGGVAVPRARGQSDALQLVRRIPAALMPTLRIAVPPLPEHVTARIRAEVPAFAGAGHDRLHRAIRDAVTVAIDGFLRLASGDDACRAVVDAHFRGLGRAEVQAGVGIHRVLAAINVASDSIWQAIRGMVAREELSGHVVADLGLAVTRYLVHLAAEVQRGAAEERQVMAGVRTRLVSALLQEGFASQASKVVELAAVAEWLPPEQVVVVVAQLHGFVPPCAPTLPTDALMRPDGDRLVVVTVEAQVPQVTKALLSLDARVLVAESWPVPLMQTRHGYRWGRRALALARKGELRPEGRVVRCARHRMALWLAADQALADDISQELLAPLQAAKPRRRMALAETLIVWLETDESASALGRRLGVHPNTVRSRLAALYELFGERLREPDQRTALILALEAAVPRWRAELGVRR